MVEGFQGIHGTTPYFYALECRACIGDMMCNVMPLGFQDVIFLFQCIILSILKIIIPDTRSTTAIASLFSSAHPFGHKRSSVPLDLLCAIDKPTRGGRKQLAKGNLSVCLQDPQDVLGCNTSGERVEKL